MANNEVVKILRVETQGSERTVKSLKQEISSLKDALLNLEKGSQEYDDTVKQLKKNQDDLATVMNAGKQDVEALEGSYNHLVKTMAELKKEWRATTDDIKRNELGQQIDSINTKLKDMDASIGNYQRNVGNYADSFSEAMKQQQESTELTRAKLESVGKIASGLASGYAAVQGAMALFGVENEKLAKTFVKLQAAIALAQGVSGLKDLVEGLGMAKVAFKSAILGVKSFIVSLNGVKAAIASTGIGLLVVALGMVVGYFMSMDDEAEETAESVDELADSMERLKKSMEYREFNESLTALENYKKAIIAAKGDVNKLQEAQKAYNDELKKTEKIRLLAAKNEWEKQYAEALRKVRIARTSSEDGALDKALENLQKAEQELLSIKKSLIKIEEDEQNAIVEAAVKANEEAVEQAKKRKEKITEIHNRLLESMMGANELELFKLKEKYEEEKKLLKGRNNDLVLLENEYNINVAKVNEKYKQERLAREKEFSQKLRDELDDRLTKSFDNQGYKEGETEVKFDGKTPTGEIQAIQYEIDKLNELRKIRLDFHNERLAQIEETLSVELLSAEMRTEIENEKAKLVRENALEEQRYINETSKLQKEKIKEEKELKRQQVSSSIDVTRNLLDSTSKLFKQNSNEYKGIASAVATIDALKSANAAYSSLAGIPVVGTALGAAAAAAALVAGYANVKAIWDTDETGSNSLSTLGSAATVTPTFNASESMPVDYTRNIMTDAEMDEINKPTKVYVLESDITETQNKVEVTESNATF